MDKKYFTCDVHGNVGCHDASKDMAEVDLASNKEKYPDDEWEMFEEDFDGE